MSAIMFCVGFYVISLIVECIADYLTESFE